MPSTNWQSFGLGLNVLTYCVLVLKDGYFSQVLTHLPLDKMAAILADDIFKCIFLNETDRIQIQISLKLVPKSPIDNKRASWWRHQMETFPRYWPFVRGIHRSPVNSPHKGQWHGALMFYLICARINGWVNNHKACDLRCHRAHYDVTVMIGSGNGLVPNKRQAIIWANTDPVHWCVYASLRGDGLMCYLLLLQFS